MEKENATDNEKLRDDDKVSDDNAKDSDLNKSKKGHVTDLNENIVKTERRIEEMNKSIMGHGIFDF